MHLIEKYKFHFHNTTINKSWANAKKIYTILWVHICRYDCVAHWTMNRVRNFFTRFLFHIPANELSVDNSTLYRECCSFCFCPIVCVCASGTAIDLECTITITHKMRTRRQPIDIIHYPFRYCFLARCRRHRFFFLSFCFCSPLCLWVSVFFFSFAVDSI